jgi:hypothetical protein
LKEQSKLGSEALQYNLIIEKPKKRKAGKEGEGGENEEKTKMRKVEPKQQTIRKFLVEIKDP